MATADIQQLGTDEILCWQCGTRMSRQSAFCSSCGAAIGAGDSASLTAQANSASQPNAVYRAGRSKTTAVLLAIFLGSLTWLYTWREDKTKFILGFGVGLGLGVLRVATNSGGLSTIGAVLWGWSLGVYIWALVDSIRRPSSWYAGYN